MTCPGKKKKTTVELPEVILRDALEVSGKSLNETVVMGLRLIAAQKSFADLRSMRGKYKSKLNVAEMRDDD
jgi:hypothetical protein